MHGILWLFLVSVLGLAAYNGVAFSQATGTTAQRLAAGWRGSMTLFIGAWGGLLSIGATGLDGLAAMTGDPQFSALADSVKAIIPAAYHPFIPVAVIGATMIARTRTLPRGP